MTTMIVLARMFSGAGCYIRKLLQNYTTNVLQTYTFNIRLLQSNS